MSVETALENSSYIKSVVKLSTLTINNKTCNKFTWCLNLRCFKFIQVLCCIRTDSKNIKFYLIVLPNLIKINIINRAITSDMGPQNTPMWTHFNINAQQNFIIYQTLLD